MSLQPPPVPLNGQAYSTHHGKGNLGPVIAVLAVITVLGIIAAMVGRLCAGRRIPGIGQYDFEGWFEEKFRSCIDGRIGLTPPARVPHANGASVDSVPIAVPAEAPPPQETKQHLHQQQQQLHHQQQQAEEFIH